MIFDRSGGCASKPFNIVSDPRLFIRIVVGCLIVDDASLGFTMPDSENTFRLTLGGIKFVVQRQPFVVPAFDTLITRGTTCWRAKWADERPSGWPSVERDEWPLVLKSSWPYIKRPHEGHLLHRLRGDPAVPEVIAWGVAKLHDQDYTTHHSRGGFAMRTLHPASVRSYSRSGSRSNSSRSRQSRSSLRGRVVKRSQRTQPRLPACSMPAETARFHARINHLTIMIYVGRPFRAAERPASELFAVLGVAVAAIGRLYVRHGILHRDISSRNILMAEGLSFRMRQNPWAALIDFDMALNRSSPATQSPERTGTLRYMAILLLDTKIRVPHLVWFDLESVFWYMFIEVLHASLLADHATELDTAASLGDMYKGKMALLESFGRLHSSVERNSTLSPAIKALWCVLHTFNRRLLDESQPGFRFSYGVEGVIVFGASVRYSDDPPPMAQLPGPNDPFATTPQNVRAWVDVLLGQVLSVGRQHCESLRSEHVVFRQVEEAEA